MSTFLQTLAVVVISIAAATAITVKDPNQPATLRESKRTARGERHVDPRPPRDRRTRRERPPRLIARPDTRPLKVPATAEMGGFSDHWTPAPVGPTVWLRLRSGIMLTVLLAMIGALVAVALGSVVVFVAVALRSAVS